jgi:CHAT domain-containing protein
MPTVPPQLLVVNQPFSPASQPLNTTFEEARQIEDAAKKYGLSVTHLASEKATVSQVLDAMPNYNWVHLACHGIQHSTAPLKSGFRLYDEKLELGTLMGKSIAQGQVAFMSACETATGDEKLPQEAVHLASGMLSAGYPSVIGTMWSIADDDGPVVAKVFYETLFQEGSESNWQKHPNVAGALHKSIDSLRDKLGDSEEALSRWVPFVHFGQ